MSEKNDPTTWEQSVYPAPPESRDPPNAAAMDLFVVQSIRVAFVQAYEEESAAIMSRTPGVELPAWASLSTADKQRILERVTRALGVWYQAEMRAGFERLFVHCADMVRSTGGLL